MIKRPYQAGIQFDEVFLQKNVYNICIYRMDMYGYFFYKECSIKRKREYIGLFRKGEGYYMNEMTSTQKSLAVF